MLKTIEGIFRNGKVELLEPAPQTQDARVVIAFLSSSSTIDLPQRGINPAAAADLRSRVSAFTEDWDRPDMDVYDEV